MLSNAGLVMAMRISVTEMVAELVTNPALLCCLLLELAVKELWWQS